MLTKDLYIGIIRRAIKINYIYSGNTPIEIMLRSQQEVDTQIIKLALLRKKNEDYIDLETNISYPTFPYKVGAYFICEEDLQPYNEIIEEKTTKYITKRKALTKFNEIK